MSEQMEEKKPNVPALLGAGVEVDIREFIRDNESAIFEKGIISPLSETKMLNGKSVDGLISLMKEKGVYKLTGPNHWFLDVDYNFKNLYAPAGQKGGNLNDPGIQRPGIVFLQQNTHINPLYDSYTGDTKNIETLEVKQIINSENIEVTDGANFEGDRIDSLDKYIKRVGSIQEENQSSIIWYRGHSSSKWVLEPKIYRKNEHLGGQIYGYEADKEFIGLFKSYALPFVQSSPSNEWEWMSIMQHYGMPTRLLDFTEDPFIALSFALQIDTLTESSEQGEVKDDAIVWIFNPLAYNEGSQIRLNQIPNMADLPEDLSNLYMPNSYIHSRTNVPMACIGVLDNHRVISQKGTFLLFPRLDDKDIKSFEKQCEDKAILDKIVIQKEDIKDIRRQLRNMGYNHTKLYPGLDSVSRDILYNYCRSKLSE